MSLMRRENVWEERNEHEKDWVINKLLQKLNRSHVSSLNSKNLPSSQGGKTQDTQRTSQVSPLPCHDSSNAGDHPL